MKKPLIVALVVGGAVVFSALIFYAGFMISRMNSRVGGFAPFTRTGNGDTMMNRSSAPGGARMIGGSRAGGGASGMTLAPAPRAGMSNGSTMMGNNHQPRP